MTFAARDGMDMLPDPRGPDPRFPLGGPRGSRIDTPDPLWRFGPDRASDTVSPALCGGGGAPPYVELHAHSAYSFLDGASLPEELAARAAELG